MHALQLADPSVAAHYRDLAREFPDMQPMHELVVRLSNQAYASHLPVVTSLDVLVIGPITVAYWSHVKVFRICYHTRRKKELDYRFAYSTEAERLINALAIRAFSPNTDAW